MLLLFKLNTLYQFKGQYHILIIMSFLSNIVLDRYDEQFDFLYYILFIDFHIFCTTLNIKIIKLFKIFYIITNINLGCR